MNKIKTWVVEHKPAAFKEYELEAEKIKITVYLLKEQAKIIKESLHVEKN
jgi:hypothetical protein